MSWARLDDGFYDHPKVLATSNAAIGLYCKALTYATKHLTDGVIPTAIVTRTLAGTDAEIDELLRNTLWKRCGESFEIVNYLSYQPSSKSVKKEKKRARDGMRALRVTRRKAVTRNRDGMGGDGESSSSGEEKKEQPPCRTKSELTEAFETRFWPAYPPRNGRRDGKPEALAEWLKLAPDVALEAEILAALPAYAKSTDYPKDACRWLKGKRWTDETQARAAPVVSSLAAAKAEFQARLRAAGVEQ